MDIIPHSAESVNGPCEDTPILTEALACLDRGWPVVPLCWPDEHGRCACPKHHVNEKEIGKAPLLGNGYQDLRLTREELTDYWTQYPRANDGILLHPSGLFVLDGDSAEADREIEALGCPPGPRVCRGDHFHRYFRNSTGLLGNATRQGESGKIDILTLGYVVGPGSLHRSGQRYEWEVRPEECPLEDPPVWAVDLIREAIARRGKAEAEEIPGDLPRVDLDALKLPRWLQAVIRCGEAADPARYPSRSEAVFAVLCSLIEAGHRDPGTLAAILLNADFVISEKPREQGAGWLAGEIARAKAKCNGNGPASAPEPEWSDTGAERKSSPWALAKSAPAFLAEEEKEFTGIAKDLIAPGVVTLIASPKGLGKTQVIHALAVALGSASGVFRGERVSPCRVLLLDRENARAIVKKRLRAWGAVAAENLRVLTRQDAPDLKDRAVWKAFPVEEHDVVIIDSVGASTEGITEKEGKQTTEVLATLQDLATRGVAIVLLQNTEKTGTNIRGRGEWVDRADIQYEVRDATGFIPSGKRPWWLELPADGAADWAERAARRKGRTDYRLAFIVAKFRIAAEPDPFCLEISLPEGEPWTLRDVTGEVLKAGEETIAKAEQAKNEKLEKAAVALAAVVKDRAATGDPITKTEAEEYLHQEEHLSRDAARAVILDNVGRLWRVEQIEGRKGRPKALYTLSQTDDPRKYAPPENPQKTRASEAGISAGTDSKPRENTMPQKGAKNGLSKDTLFSRADSNATAEMPSQKSPSNGAPRDSLIFADEEVEKQDLDAEVL